ncbi:MAG: hypothetical protein M0R80_08220 [Proteobacteria bacterium]|jgi:hypothetical protein|nr:hypothetical protein [Pseudomonadota bacterium]
MIQWIESFRFSFDAKEVVHHKELRWNIDAIYAKAKEFKKEKECPLSTHDLVNGFIKECYYDGNL